MACDVATHGREEGFRNTPATGICPDGALVQEAFKAPPTVKPILIIKVTGPLAGWKPLDIGSGLTGPSSDLALQKAEGTVLDIYINSPELNKLRGIQCREPQPATHPADTMSTVKSARFHTDGDSL